MGTSEAEIIIDTKDITDIVTLLIHVIIGLGQISKTEGCSHTDDIGSSECNIGVNCFSDADQKGRKGINSPNGISITEAIA